ncbi:hypothetical protein HBA54_04160 [Pelagibius litoralis]|uniref:Uncharacterized protein n=1 Tax=Pelagibius litoralis TaxID=374515 RepID=A0A967EUV9_9PROT|nr:packaged DNA stabilization gp4 family protein [Pelagibius litoralis]NIA67776.1 hypothetical protein [Pelagibius litoralis]
MTTARSLIQGSLRLIRVVADEETPTNSQMVDGLERMNEMLHGLKAHNADIGYQDITLDDDIPLPPEHIRPVRYMLAVELAPEFSGNVTPEVAVEAKAGMLTLQSAYRRIGKLRPDEGLENRLTRHGYDIDADY